jgi:tRNA pseudouridine55 synthase
MGQAPDYTTFPVISKSESNWQQLELKNGAIFLIDKAPDWSSFHAVKLLRGRIGIKKVGHAGTLDPLATGLLVICAGKATKSIEQIQQQPKTYEAEITFGSATPSMDLGTEYSEYGEVDHLDRTSIESVLQKDFNGRIKQVPPMYSALKKDGKRLYKLARQGKEVERKPREVEIYAHSVLEWKKPVLRLEIKCSKGTYIRSIADDLGRKLNTVAHLSGLRRTEIGSFRVDEAIPIQEIKDEWQSIQKKA